MLNDFLLSFRLKNTYRTNSIIYSLKSIPLVTRLLPASLYACDGLKVFALVISVILEFFSAFLGKALSLGFLFLVCMLVKANRADSFLHMLFFTTLVGGYMNTHMFNPTKDKYYAMFCMRMDAAGYTLSNYLYFLFKILLGFLAFGFLFGRLCGLNTLSCLLIPVLVIEIKLFFSAMALRAYTRSGKYANENKLSRFQWLGTAVLLGAAFLLPALGYAMKEALFCGIAAVLLLPAVFAMRYLLGFDHYRQIYKELLEPDSFLLSSKELVSSTQQKAMQETMTTDTAQTSSKFGYRYFNEIFMKRHSRLLTKSSERISLIAALIFACAILICQRFPALKGEVNERITLVLPYFLFLMYLVNRGKTITRAMFMNCDHSMLTYRFYRQPKAILTLFVERLKYVILISLMPAAVIGLGLVLLLFFTGGTSQPLNYVLLFVSIIAMSIFFSVHNMVLYYLLQPYNVNLEAKSTLYSIIDTVTYIVCYIAIGENIPAMTFGVMISAFCFLYAAAASVLAYRRAPTPFRLRK